MFQNYAPLTDKCRPMTIVRDGESAWGTIGGAAPRGIEPPVITDFTRYFATIKTSDEQATELSLFISMDYELSSPISLLKNKSIIHSSENTLVQFVLHKPAARGDDRRLDSELSGNRLIIENEYADSDDMEKIWNHHKIGGYPFFTRYHAPIVGQCKNLMREGYLHLLQFSFPDRKDAIASGSWPFADCIFHVFSKNLGGQIDFRYCWAR